MNPLHFLIATRPVQGHIAPARQLARLLVRATGGAVTISTPISAHRRMFPSSEDSEVEEGSVTYSPYSDGYDDGFDLANIDPTDYWPQAKAVGSKTLSAVLRSLARRKRPVHCLIHTLFMSWVCEVAREHCVPSVLYWVQSATSFSISYNYLHGHGNAMTSNDHADASSSSVEFPRLRTSLDVGDLPSLLTISEPHDPFFPMSVMYREIFESLDCVPKQRVLVNSFDALETFALEEAGKLLHVFAIGPVLPFLRKEGTKDVKRLPTAADLFKVNAKAYMEWMDSKPNKSIVYVSFGSIAVLKKQQMEAILRGLKRSGRPFLWAARADNGRQREERAEIEAEVRGSAGNGMMVEWCDQWEVLSHPATGCFVTHCGWNSTSESLACGVPTVGAPLFMDQKLNARLMEEWGMGVRCKMNEEGNLEEKELAKCLEIVMGEGGVEMRKRAAEWRDRVQEATSDGGSSDRSLRAFVEQIVAAASK